MERPAISTPTLVGASARRPLLIGQAPGPNTKQEFPLFPVPSTSAGGRLQQMTGLTRGGYLKTFERVNLLYEFPGRHKRDDKFPVAQARVAAQAMRPLLAGRVVVFVGRNVANAFDFDEDFHVWRESLARRYCLVSKTPFRFVAAVIPHPSGRNHWYNNEENRARSAEFWQNFFEPDDK